MADKETNKLIEDSGIITHVKVANILKGQGWKFIVSPYYYDDITGAIREADLVAEKQFSSANQLPALQVNIQFFIECKYIKQEVIFWFNKIDTGKAVKSLEKETGLTIALDKSGNVTVDKLHYFNQASVAKLFTTNSNKEDVIFKAMNQSLHSLIHDRKAGKKPLSFNFFDHAQFKTIIQYPIIVCDNFENLSHVKFDDKGGFKTEKLREQFLLETNYRDDYFLIDVVDVNFLETFLIRFENEAQALIAAYKDKHNIF